MEAQAIFERLQARFGESVSDFTTAGTKDPFCKVKPGRLVEVMRALRDEPDLRFDFLQNLTAVDWIKQATIQVVYHLWSYPHLHGFVIKVEAPRDNPVFPSVTGVWKTADWLEREQFDLLGALFEGHPDLRRLLLPDDWEGYPMRKDYKEAASYRDMPTTRYSPLELLAAFDKANPQVEGQRPTAPPPKAGAKGAAKEEE